jgi:hypothetical protein
MDQRDDLVLEAAVTLLQATELFEPVIIGKPTEMPAPASETFACLWVWIDEATDTDHEHAEGTVRQEHLGQLGIALEVRHTEALTRMQRLERLKSAIRNTLNRQPLASICLPSTRVGGFADDVALRLPSVRVATLVEFRYIVDSPTAYTVTDRESAW